jgi:tetratricopeptide (TPR) repeat protein
LTGTIQREGEEIRVTAQLYDVRQQRSLWTGKFDEKKSNIFSVQDAISEQIAKELAGKIQTDAPVLTEGKYTKNIEAHQAYSMGLFHWNKRSDDGLKKAVSDFQTAIEKDPEFVLAHAYLADTYTLIAYYRFDFMSAEEAREKAKTAAEKALELDPNCSEAMTALAVNQIGRENTGKTFELLKRAIEIKPNNATAHQRIAWQYAARGDIEKALEEMQTAQNLDPQARNTNIGLATVLNYARRPDDSLIYSRRVLEFDPANATAKLSAAESLEQKGELEKAEQMLDQISQTDKNFENARVVLARIYAKTDRQTDAQNILNKIVGDKKAERLAYEIALAYSALGNENTALSWLEKSVSESGGLIRFFISNDYNLDVLRRNGKLNKYGG